MTDFEGQYSNFMSHVLTQTYLHVHMSVHIHIMQMLLPASYGQILKGHTLSICISHIRIYDLGVSFDQSICDIYT